MLIDVIEVKPLEPYRILVRFEDGLAGEVDVAELVPFQGVFATLATPGEFRKVTVHRELGVVCWPGGADLDSDVLYSVVTKQPIASRTLA